MPTLSQVFMWTEKYRPKSLGEIVGNEEAKTTFISWLRKWKPGSRAALLYGPPGVGKTTLVQVAADVFGYDFLEMNASDARTAERVMQVAGHAASETSLLRHFSGSRGTVILLDEVDGIHGREDQGGIGAVIKVIEESKVPVVLVANDISDMRLRDLKAECIPIRFYHVRPPVILPLLEEICRKEGIDAEGKALKTIASRCEGDVRSAINDLQSAAASTGKISVIDLEGLLPRDRQLAVQQTLQEIFLAKNPMQARRALAEAEVDYEMLEQAIHDNLPFQYKDPGDLAAAYDALSQADVFLGRIKRTRDWGLLSYGLEQMSIGVAASRSQNYQPVGYRFPPSKLIILSRTKAQRQIRDAIGMRIGGKCHVSRRRALADFLPFLKVVFENNGEDTVRMASCLDLDERMTSYLGGKEVKPAKKTTRRRKSA